MLPNSRQIKHKGRKLFVKGNASEESANKAQRVVVVTLMAIALVFAGTFAIPITEEALL